MPGIVLNTFTFILSFSHYKSVAISNVLPSLQIKELRVNAWVNQESRVGNQIPT